MLNVFTLCTRIEPKSVRPAVGNCRLTDRGGIDCMTCCGNQLTDQLVLSFSRVSSPLYTCRHVCVCTLRSVCASVSASVSVYPSLDLLLSVLLSVNLTAFIYVFLPLYLFVCLCFSIENRSLSKTGTQCSLDMFTFSLQPLRKHHLYSAMVQKQHCDAETANALTSVWTNFRINDPTIS